jgi:hypothetical protein
MMQLTTRQQAARSGRGRRLKDAAAQQRVLKAMGVQISLDELKSLPRGAWVRFVPEDAPLRIARGVRGEELKA